MILATMILMLAALVIIVIGFVMDRLAIRKIQSGMRTLNKRIKKIEKEICPDPIIITGPDGEDFQKALANLEKMDTEEVNYEAVDPEPEEADDCPSTDQADGEV